MKKSLQRITLDAGLLVLIAFAAAFGLAAESTTMTRAEAKLLVTSASTPEDHHRLAAYFTQKAENMDAEVAEHEELVREYNPVLHSTKHPLSGRSAGHCRDAAQAARKVASADRALAAAHEGMAKTQE